MLDKLKYICYNIRAVRKKEVIKMKVYLVYYDNGEEYPEDYESWVQEVCSTKEKAEDFVKKYHEDYEYFLRIEEWEVE